MTTLEIDPETTIMFARELPEEYDELIEEEYALYCLDVYKERCSVWVND